MSELEKLSDSEITELLNSQQIRPYNLEKLVEPARAVKIRHDFLLGEYPQSVQDEVLYADYRCYDVATKSCCENVIGYIPIPLGIAGPILLNDKQYNIPIATTEGALVASLSRGCRAVRESGGITSTYTNCGMTRAPLLKFKCAKEAKLAIDWIEQSDNMTKLQDSFASTSRYARLKSICPKQAGNLVFLRVAAFTGEAMGMNMISKGCDKMLEYMQHFEVFQNMRVLSISGNYCVDKKASAMNWINNRGHSVTCDLTLPASVLSAVLKTDARALVELNTSKNLIGSAMAGCIGGNNAHANNIVCGIYAATGQDIAQSATSSMTMLTMEVVGDGDLYVSATMPCIEVGTVGGGTTLQPQNTALKLISTDREPVTVEILAQVVCGAVLAGELSLLSAMCTGDLVRSHLNLNRQ